MRRRRVKNAPFWPLLTGRYTIHCHNALYSLMISSVSAPMRPARPLKFRPPSKKSANVTGAGPRLEGGG